MRDGPRDQAARAETAATPAARGPWWRWLFLVPGLAAAYLSAAPTTLWRRIRQLLAG